MAVNNINNTYTKLRLTGLSSGMDTDSIIKNMMQLEQLKVNRELRARTTLQWRQTAYSSVVSDLDTFRNTFFSQLGAKNMLNSNVYTKYKVALSGANAHAVSVSADSSAFSGSVTIDSVTRLAKASSVKSHGETAPGEDPVGIFLEGEEAGGGVALKDLKLKTALEFDGGQISFKINGEEFSFKETDTLQQVFNTVNARESAGVTMRYSQLDGKISIESKETGAASKIELENGKGNAFAPGGAFGIGEGTFETGEDAELSINGIRMTRSSNSFAIDGVTYRLNETTASSIRVDLKKDIDGAVEQIKGFVEAYNELVKKLDGAISERKKLDEQGYAPLTEEEKSLLSEKQLEQHEAIAKKGLLYNDTGIKNMLSDMRAALYEAVESAGLSPADIGLRTGAYQNRGQISLDETALRAALEEDSDRVMRAFMNIPSEGGDSGFLYKIQDIMYNYSMKVSPQKLTQLDDTLRRMNDKISGMEKKMTAYEERLYARFAAMEEALAKLQSQSDWLSGMLSSK